MTKMPTFLTSVGYRLSHEITKDVIQTDSELIFPGCVLYLITGLWILMKKAVKVVKVETINLFFEYSFF